MIIIGSTEYLLPGLCKSRPPSLGTLYNLENPCQQQGNNRPDHTLHFLPRTPSTRRSCMGQKHHFLQMTSPLQTAGLAQTAYQITQTERTPQYD